MFVCKLNMSMLFLYRLQVFRFHLTLRRISRTSDQMHPGYTSGINNGRKVQDVYSMIHNKHVHLYI